MKRAALVLTAGLLLGSASALAAPPPAPPGPPTTPAATPVKQPDWLRKDKAPSARTLETKRGPSPLRIGGMLLLVATLGGVAYYAKRRRQSPKGIEPKSQLKVLGTTRVGPKASAVVVEITGKRILLGVTDQSVSTLAWLDDEPDAAAPVRDDSRVEKRASTRTRDIDEEAVAGPSGFLRLLRNAVGTAARPSAAPADELARSTRDEVRLSHRETEELPVEGQVMGLAKRRRELP